METNALLCAGGWCGITRGGDCQQLRCWRASMCRSVAGCCGTASYAYHVYVPNALFSMKSTRKCLMSPTS